MLETRKLYDGFYALEDARVRQFLVLGEGEALLFDTGFADSGVHAAVRTLTAAPVTVLMTHGDVDHAGGLADFGEAWLAEGDWPLVQAAVTLHPLREGDVFRCGGYAFEVIAIPGHSAGSVAFYDAAKKLLIAGDSVQQGGPIFMFGGHRDLDRYIESLEKLACRIPADVTVLSCHSACAIDAAFIARDLADARALRDGCLESDPHPALPCRVYHGKSVDFLYDEGQR